MVAELPSPLRIQGEFMLQGVQDLNFLTASFHKNPSVCTYCGVSPKQGDLIVAVLPCHCTPPWFTLFYSNLPSHVTLHSIIFYFIVPSHFGLFYSTLSLHATLAYPILFYHSTLPCQRMLCYAMLCYAIHFDLRCYLLPSHVILFRFLLFIYLSTSYLFDNHRRIVLLDAKKHGTTVY